MRRGSMKGRTLLLVLLLLPLAGLFVYVMTNSGPLAPVPVTVAEVESRSISPALYGIGVVESRAVHRIGATSPGRLLWLDAQVGEMVAAGQVLGELDPVDLNDRIEGQRAAVRRLESLVAAADSRVAETKARKEYAEAQAARYENLLKKKAVSVEAADAKRQERRTTAAAWSSARADAEAARAEQARAGSELKGLLAR
ncbi:MAG: efflux transporter periplasmic adaptor subunit, partial [Spartobacteria bacterium]|nr:efflux transporter periplasmic adaptor subunit [Spartobacteria bacterium]